MVTTRIVLLTNRLADTTKTQLQERHMTTNTAIKTAYLARPRAVAAELTATAAVKGLRVLISWKWVGRDRSGAVYVKRAGECLFATVYPRGNQRWDQNKDASLTSCNMNSSKHHALIAANRFVQALA